MNKNLDESADFLNQFKGRDLSVSDSKIIICPSFVSLIFGYKANNKISFGAQNISPSEEGSQTGEISIDMLENINCDWVIIGHSERRELFNETDDDIANKMGLVYTSSLNPILCIGESILLIGLLLSGDGVSYPSNSTPCETRKFAASSVKNG